LAQTKNQKIFANLKNQEGIAHLFAELMRIRKSLVGDNLEAESAPSISVGGWSTVIIYIPVLFIVL
jgi:hypothetical protein